MQADLDKAALQGLSASDVTRTVQMGLSGASAGLLHEIAEGSGRTALLLGAPLTLRDRGAVDVALPATLRAAIA